MYCVRCKFISVNVVRTTPETANLLMSLPLKLENRRIPEPLFKCVKDLLIAYRQKVEISSSCSS